MVQSRLITTSGHIVPATPKTYWMLAIPSFKTISGIKRYLRARNFTAKSTLTHARGTELMTRFARGLMSYERYKISELKAMAKSRGVLPYGNAKMAEIIKILEDADEGEAFRHLLDLPPELRNLIYTYFFDWVEDLPTNARHPPITIASKQLHNETLPLFYARCTFRFPIHDGILDWAVERQLKVVGPEIVARISRFNFSFFPGERAAWCTVLLNLNDNDQPIKRTSGPGSIVEITAEMKGVAREIVEGPRETRFGRSDIEALIRAFERGCWKRVQNT